MTKNPTVLKWLEEMKTLLQPENVVWIDGSKEQIEALIEFQERFFEHIIVEEIQNIKDKGEER